MKIKSLYFLLAIIFLFGSCKKDTSKLVKHYEKTSPEIELDFIKGLTNKVNMNLEKMGFVL